MSSVSSWHIAQGSVGDASTAVAILQEVSRWLEQQGRPLWNPASFSVGEFAQAASVGELVLGYDGDSPVACMLLQARDALHWPNDRPGEALYVHKLAVRRRDAGQDWSGRMITWARARAFDAGVKFLRLDTAPRSKLISLYQKHGFSLIDETPRLVGDFLAVRLEMRLVSGNAR